MAKGLNPVHIERMSVTSNTIKINTEVIFMIEYCIFVVVS